MELADTYALKAYILYGCIGANPISSILIGEHLKNILIHGFKHSFDYIANQIEKTTEKMIFSKYSLDYIINERLPIINQFDLNCYRDYVVVFDNSNLDWVLIGKAIYEKNINLLHLKPFTKKDKKEIDKIYKKLKICSPFNNKEKIRNEYGIFSYEYLE